MRVVLRNVCKDIKGARVLDNVNLELESGMVYGFKGKNGSGKTMLMRAISGLIKVKGEIEIDGKILGKDFTFPPSIGILIENPSFVADGTIVAAAYYGDSILSNLAAYYSNSEQNGSR
mgnify:CR=1 FL=1